MQNQKLPVSSQQQNTLSPEQKNFSTTSASKHQTSNYLTTLGLIASISSIGVAASLHQPAQATTNILKPTLIAELPSLDTSVDTSTVENQSAIEISHGDQNQDSLAPKIQIQSNLEQNTTTQAIPQIPALEPQIQPKQASKKIYTVQVGDNLTKIALKHGVSSRQIIEANQLTNPNFIKVNHQLVIPSLDSGQEPNYQNTEVSSEKQFSLNNAWEISQATTPNSLSSLREIKAESGDKKQVVESTVNNFSEKETTNETTATDSYLTKLRQDIIDLRTKYQQQNGSNDTAVANPTIPNQKLVNINTPVTNAVSEKVNNQETNVSSKEQSIASAPTPVENFNSLIILRTNQTVTPDLPPLASPEEYLPDNPIFNGYMWPANGTLTSGYGWRRGRMHQGIDIAAPIGTPIMAAASGEVVFAGWNSGGYGNLVQIKHPDGSVTFYAHNNRLLVNNGQKVKQGQLIAEMGSTGRSTGPHLHFEIRPNGTTAINPIARLPKERLN